MSISRSKSDRQPDISIVVPVRNGAETIERALESLYAQDLASLELIVVDGASTDATGQILEAHRGHIDVLIQEPDTGQADALNKGFARATGRYFGWLCADDVLRQGALAALSAALEADPDADLVTGGCRRVFEDGRIVETRPAADFDTRLFWINTIEQPSTLWRAGLHRRAGQLDLGLRYAFDWDWWCRLKTAGGQFIAISDIVSEYHFSKTNLTSSGGDRLAEEMFEVIRRHGPHGGRLAYAYRFLYRQFDKRGFYDPDAPARLTGRQRAVFHLVLRGLHAVFGRELIDSYNWNFASRQARGLDWSH